MAHAIQGFPDVRIQDRGRFDQVLLEEVRAVGVGDVRTFEGLGQVVPHGPMVPPDTKWCQLFVAVTVSS